MARLRWFQGREIQEAVSGAKSNRWHLPCCWLPFLFVGGITDVRQLLLQTVGHPARLGSHRARQLPDIVIAECPIVSCRIRALRPVAIFRLFFCYHLVMFHQFRRKGVFFHPIENLLLNFTARRFCSLSGVIECSYHPQVLQIEI